MEQQSVDVLRVGFSFLESKQDKTAPPQADNTTLWTINVSSEMDQSLAQKV